MEARTINEGTFRALLLQWHVVGRGLLTLPKVTRTKDGISVALVSLDNATINTLENAFQNYKAYLSWYGDQLDKIGYY
uniref:Uncharacterized protein n=1 Tax=Rheinheimera sp. BAL341 TaxID=1708203 RepID=A0A486XIQ1_9GAMM